MFFVIKLFTRGALLRSYFKKKNSLERVRASQIELEFGSVGFKGDGKTGLPGEPPTANRALTLVLKQRPGELGNGLITAAVDFGEKMRYFLLRHTFSEITTQLVAIVAVKICDFNE